MLKRIERAKEALLDILIEMFKVLLTIYLMIAVAFLIAAPFYIGYSRFLGHDQ